MELDTLLFLHRKIVVSIASLIHSRKQVIHNLISEFTLAPALILWRLFLLLHLLLPLHPPPHGTISLKCGNSRCIRLLSILHLLRLLPLLSRKLLRPCHRGQQSGCKIHLIIWTECVAQQDTLSTLLSHSPLSSSSLSSVLSSRQLYKFLIHFVDDFSVIRKIKWKNYTIKQIYKQTGHSFTLHLCHLHPSEQPEARNIVATHQYLYQWWLSLNTNKIRYKSRK